MPLKRQIIIAQIIETIKLLGIMEAGIKEYGFQLISATLKFLISEM
jgi:hypothetical protein